MIRPLSRKPGGLTAARWLASLTPAELSELAEILREPDLRVRAAVGRDWAEDHGGRRRYFRCVYIEREPRC